MSSEVKTQDLTDTQKERIEIQKKNLLMAVSLKQIDWFQFLEEWRKL